MVWHGSSKEGKRQPDSFCEDWRTNSPAVTGMASPLQSGHFLQEMPRSCSNSYILLCIENSYIAKWGNISLVFTAALKHSNKFSLIF